MQNLEKKNYQIQVSFNAVVKILKLELSHTWTSIILYIILCSVADFFGLICEISSLKDSI